MKYNDEFGTSPYSFDKDVKPQQLPLSKLRFGAAWDISGGGRKGLLGKLAKRRGVDLDLIVIASQGKDAKRLCWFDHVRPFGNAALEHLGDNTTGRGDGDDEEILADLPLLPPFIDRLTTLVCAYKPNVSFDSVTGVTLTVYDEQTGTPLQQFMPTLGQPRNAVVVAQLQRDSFGWGLSEINEMVNVNVSGNAGNDQAAFVRLAGRYYRSL